MSNSAQPHRQQPTRLPRPWDSPGKNTGVSYHFLLQFRKVKSESEVTQSCPTLSDPMDCSLPGSSIHGIFKARVLEWVAIAFSAEPPGKPPKVKVLVTQLCLILCESPGSSVHGILQARRLEWVAIPSSGGIFLTRGLNPSLLHCRRSLALQADSLPLRHQLKASY